MSRACWLQPPLPDAGSVFIFPINGPSLPHLLVAGLRNLTHLVCQLLEDQSVSVRVQSAAALAAVADGLAESTKADANTVHDLSAVMIAGELLAGFKCARHEPKVLDSMQ